MHQSDTPLGLGSSDGLGLAPERALLNRLHSLKALLGTDSPEVRGWSPVVQQSAQATVNAAITMLKAMSAALQAGDRSAAAERERWRAWVEEAVSYVGCETWSPSLKEEGEALLRGLGPNGHANRTDPARKP